MTATLRHRGALASRLLDTDPGDWRDRALCVGADPELFHPEGGSATLPAARDRYRRQVAAAKAICDRCPAKAACLDYALTEGIPFGIWGGKTENERRQRTRPIRVCEQCGKGYAGRGDKYCGHRCHHQAMTLRLGNYALTRPDCGTRSGARRHRLHGEPVDGACRLAEALYRAQLKQKETNA